MFIKNGFRCLYSTETRLLMLNRFHLTGSNLKFCKSLTGELEVVTPLSDDEDVEGEKIADDLSQEVEKYTAPRNRRGNFPLIHEIPLIKSEEIHHLSTQI